MLATADLCTLVIEILGSVAYTDEKSGQIHSNSYINLRKGKFRDR